MNDPDIGDIPPHDHGFTCGEDFCENCGDCLACYGTSDGYCQPYWKPEPWHCCEQARLNA